MKLKKRKLTLRDAIVSALAVALLASMTVFFTVNAAEGDVVTPTDEIIAEVDEDSPEEGAVPSDADDSVPEIADGESAAPKDTDTNPYGEPTVTLTTNKKIGESFEITLCGENLMIDYGNNTAVPYPGDRIVRGSTMRIYGTVTQIVFPYQEDGVYDGEEYRTFMVPSGVTSIDVSKAVNLVRLDCSYSSIKSLDLSNNPELTVLYCGANSLTELDLSNNTQLTEVSCYSNQLTSLDLSGLSMLTLVECSNNKLVSLVLPETADVSYLSCQNNKLTSLDVSHYSNLVTLNCDGNNIRSLNLQNNTSLKHLTCSDNKLSSIDLSANTLLEELNCSDNKLTELDISNCGSLYALNCANNALRFSTITLNSGATYGECAGIGYEYNPDTENFEECTRIELVEVDFSGQPRIAISDFVQAGQAVDLSSEFTEGTVFTWYDENGDEIFPISSDNGCFVFSEYETGKTLYCKITNERYLNRKNTNWPDLDDFDNWDDFNVYQDAFYDFYESHDYQTIMPSPAEIFTTKVKIVESDEVFSLPAERTLKMGLSVNLAEELRKPASMTGKISWASSNSKVATVSSNGSVKAVAAGKAIITVKCGTAKATCTIVVEKAVVLNKYSLTLTRKTSKPNPETYLSAKKPSGVKSVVWKSDNPLVVTVDTKGKLTALKEGTANITCEDAKGGSVSAPCTVTVKDFFVTTEGTMNGTQAYVLKNESISFALSGGDGQDIVWKNSNPKIASLGENALFTGVAKGTVTVTAQTADRKLSDSVKLTVVEPTTSFSIKPQEVTVYAGSTTTLKASISKNSNDPVFWSSDNAKVATVDKSGKVKGISQGEATIVATTLSGQSLTANVNVRTKAASVAWFTEDNDMAVSKELKTGIPVGSTLRLSFDVTYPANCNDTASWSSSNKKIVTVTPIEDGRTANVEAIAYGTATITVKTGSGKKLTAKITVVKTPATAITLSKSSVTLYEKATYTLTAKTAPKGNNDVVLWKTNNPRVAIVDETGKITAIGQGEADITACSSISGEVYATAHVIVRSKVQKMSWVDLEDLPEGWCGLDEWDIYSSTTTISKEVKYAVNLGESKNLCFFVESPWDCNDTITWSTSDKKIAIVEPTEVWIEDAEGNSYQEVNKHYACVTGLKKGTVTITAKAGSGKKLTAKLTVVDTPAEQIIATKREITIYEGNSATLTATKVPKTSNDVILWRAIDPYGVTVDENGRIKGLRWADYTYRVVAYSATDNNVLDIVEVTVRKKATGIKLSESSIAIEKNDSDMVSVSLTPYYSNDYVTWSTSNKKVATVSGTNNYAIIYGTGTGTATISAKTGSGKVAKLKVTVKKEVDPNAMKLRVWASERNYDFMTTATSQWATEYAAAHPEYSNVKVNVSMMDDDMTVGQALENPMLTPDVYGILSDSLDALVSDNLLYALPDSVAEEAAQTVGESTMSSAYCNGSFYGIPYEHNISSVMIYDKRLFTEDEVANLNTVLSKELSDGAVNLAVDPSAWFFMSWFSTAGSELYTGYDSSINTLNSPEAAAMIKWLIQNYQNGKIVKATSADELASMFAEGKLGACLYGSWAAEWNIENVLGENMGVVEMPYVTVPNCVNNKHMSCLASSKMLTINANTKHPEAALSLVQYLSGSDMQLMRYEMNNTIPTNVSLRNDPRISSNPIASAVTAQSDYVVIMYTNLFGRSSFWDLLQAEVSNAIFEGTLTEENVQDVLDDLVARMQSNLS